MCVPMYIYIYIGLARSGSHLEGVTSQNKGLCDIILYHIILRQHTRKSGPTCLSSSTTTNNNNPNNNKRIMIILLIIAYVRCCYKKWP